MRAYLFDSDMTVQRDVFGNALAPSQDVCAAASFAAGRLYSYSLTSDLLRTHLYRKSTGILPGDHRTSYFKQSHRLLALHALKELQLFLDNPRGHVNLITFFRLLPIALQANSKASLRLCGFYYLKIPKTLYRRL